MVLILAYSIRAIAVNEGDNTAAMPGLYGCAVIENRGLVELRPPVALQEAIPQRELVQIQRVKL